MRVFLACVLMTVFLGPDLRAEPPTTHDAREILQRANAAAAKLTAISYSATLRGDGVLAQQFPMFTASVVGRRINGGKLTQVRIDGKMSAGTNPDMPLKYINNGTEVTLIEESTKTARVGRPEDAAGLAINGLGPIRYLGDSVFHEEMRSVITLGQPETVEGVECDVVSVSYDLQNTKGARIFISKKDGLVRRVENNLAMRMAGHPDPVRGSVVFTATNLNTQPAIDEKLFVTAVPEGYKRESFPLEVAAGAGTNSPAPEWELTSADGKNISLKGLRGKFVVLDFWATWCGPCRMAMPGMQKLHERFKDKPVIVYGMNCWERNPNPMDFIKTQNYTYPQLLKADKVAAAYGVNSIPAIFVINPEGKIVHQIRGYMADAEEQIARLIEPSLKK
jgi:thiol-disulfide isomerase/thioredoxin